METAINTPKDISSFSGCGIELKQGEKLHELARQVKSGLTIVEIGTYMGRSACYMATASPEDVRVYTIDVWGSDRLLKASAWEIFMKQIKAAGVAHKIIPIKGNSIDIGKAWNLPIGLLHIDGNGKYEVTLADYKNFGRFVVPGGFIALHDYAYPTDKNIKTWQVGRRRVVEEVLKPSGEWECYEVTVDMFTARRKQI